MREEIIGEVVDCPRCGMIFTVEGAEAHDARHRREDVVAESALEMNAKGANFQPEQRWAFQHGPRGRSAKILKENG